MFEINSEFAFILIKPDAVEEGKAKGIFQKISNEIKVIAAKKVRLTKNDVEVIYSDSIGENYFPKLVDFLTGSLSIALVVFGKAARKKAAKIKDKIRKERTIDISKKDLQMLKAGNHPRQKEITSKNALRNLIHVTDEYDRTLEHIHKVFIGDA